MNFLFLFALWERRGTLPVSLLEAGASFRHAQHDPKHPNMPALSAIACCSMDGADLGTCYRLYLFSGKVTLAAVYHRRVRVVCRSFAAGASPLAHVCTVVTPPAPAAQNFSVGLGDSLRGRQNHHLGHSSKPITLPATQNLCVDLRRPCRGHNCGGMLGAMARIAPARLATPPNGASKFSATNNLETWKGCGTRRDAARSTHQITKFFVLPRERILLNPPCSVAAFEVTQSLPPGQFPWCVCVGANNARNQLFVSESDDKSSTFNQQRLSRCF
jgi:hypothetical protein